MNLKLYSTKINDKLSKSNSKNIGMRLKELKSTKHTCTEILECKADIKDIAGELTNKYESLYSSVPSSQSELIDVQNCIDSPKDTAFM